ncbi:MAG: sulfatase-like hydrolase/transferase [Bryobacteraceae bacterium]
MIARRKLLAAPFALTARTMAAAQREAPNVLLILCDQMRGDAMSGLGSPNARTPHIDRLGREGVLFERCFSNNPVCLPSRKSIFSGRFPHEHGSLTNGDGDHLPFAGSLAAALAARGYRTGYVGKNHTFEKPEMERFDFARVRDREPFRQYSRWARPNWHMDSPWPESKCYGSVNTADALRFLDERGASRDPFFLTVSYFDPHPPYMAPSGYTARYASRDMKLPNTVAPSAVSARLAAHSAAMEFDKQTDADLTETMRYYYAAIEYGVDAQVGALMAALDKRGLRGSTLVLFAADHGDFMGHYRMVRKGMLLYDHLLHVPLIARHPALASGGLRVRDTVQLVDLFPTILEAAGAMPPEGVELRGASILPLARGGSRKEIAAFASAGYAHTDAARIAKGEKEKPLHTRVLDTVMRPEFRAATIRTPEWRMTLSEADPPELFRIDGGAGERANVAAEKAHSSVRRNLEKRIAGHWRW